MWRPNQLDSCYKALYNIIKQQVPKTTFMLFHKFLAPVQNSGLL